MYLSVLIHLKTLKYTLKYTQKCIYTLKKCIIWTEKTVKCALMRFKAHVIGTVFFFSKKYGANNMRFNAH